MDSVYELVGLWMTIQTLAWHLNSLDGIGIVADAKVKVLTYCIAAKALQKPTWHTVDVYRYKTIESIGNSFVTFPKGISYRFYQ